MSIENIGSGSLFENEIDLLSYKEQDLKTKKAMSFDEFIASNSLRINDDSNEKYNEYVFLFHEKMLNEHKKIIGMYDLYIQDFYTNNDKDAKPMTFIEFKEKNSPSEEE